MPLPTDKNGNFLKAGQIPAGMQTQKILQGDAAASKAHLDTQVKNQRDQRLAELYQEYTATKNPFKKIGSLFKMARSPRANSPISDLDRTEAMGPAFQATIEEELETKWAPVRPLADTLNNQVMEQHSKKVPKLDMKKMGQGTSAPGATLVENTPDPTKPPAHPPVPKMLKVPSKKDIKTAAKEMADEQVIEMLMEKVKKPSKLDRVDETVNALSRGILLGVDTEKRSKLVQEATNRKYPKGAVQKVAEPALEFGGIFIPYVGFEYGTVKISQALRSANAVDDMFKAYPYLSRVATANAGVAVADYAWRESTGQEYGAKDFLLNIGFQGVFDAVPVLMGSKTRILAHIDEEIRTLTKELNRAPSPEEFLQRVQDRPIPGVSNYTYGKLFAEQRLAYRSGIDPNTGRPPEGRPGIDRPAPLPEPQAQLPAGRKTVQKATGNPEEIVTGLRVEKINEINSQQALRDVLMENPDILNSRTRGIIGDTELYEKAARRGYTPSQVLSLQEGTLLPAEDIIAVRQAVDAHGKETNLLKALAEKELLYGGTDTQYQRAYVQAKIEHAQLRARVKGLASEAGRATRSFRLQTDPYTAVQKAVDNMITGLDDDLARAMALDIARVPDGEDAKMLALIRDYSNPRFWGALRELGVMGKLWSPITHAVNTTSNFTYNLAIPAYRAVVAGIDVARVAVTGGQRERFLGEAVADFMGQYGKGAKQAFMGGQNMPRALQLKFRQYAKMPPAERAALEAQYTSMTRSMGEVWNALLDEYYVPSNTKLDELVGRVPAIKGRAGKNTLLDKGADIAGKVVRIPGRLLNAEDLVFRTMAFHGEMGAMASRQASKEGLRGIKHQERVAQLLASPTEEMRTKAIDMATRRVFQEELGEFGKKISQLREVPVIGDIMTVTVLPFLRTPINLTKRAVQPFNPVALTKGIKAGGGEASEAIARTVIAGTTTAMFVKLAMDGTITGPPPRDQKLREELYAQGWQPWSIRIGDEYYSYNRIEPLNSTMRWAGIAVEAYREAQTFDDPSVSSSLGEITKHIAIGTLDKTYLSGMHDFLDALFGYNDTNLGDWMQRNAFSFVPGSGLLNATTMALDEAPDGGQIIRDPESFIEYFQSRIPGLQGDVKPKIDSEGRLATKGGTPLERFISPVQRDTAKKSKEEINKLINDWNEVKHLFKGEDSQRAVYQNEAIKLIEQWEREEWDGRRKNAEFRALQRANPPVAEAMESILSKDDPGLDLIEEKLKNARVDQRAAYVKGKLEQFTTTSEKNAFFKELQAKKIITDSVIEALIEDGVLPKSYMPAGRSRRRNR